MTLDNFDRFIQLHARKGNLGIFPGVGRSTVRIVEQIIAEGTIEIEDELFDYSEYFWGEIRQLPACGKGVLQCLYANGISTFSDLKEALERDILDLPRSVKKELNKYLMIRDYTQKDFIGIPNPIAYQIADEFAKDHAKLDLKLCGETRTLSPRVKSIEFITTIGDIDTVDKYIRNHRYYRAQASIKDTSISCMIFPGIHCIIHIVPKNKEIFYRFLLSSSDRHIQELAQMADERTLRLSKDGIYQGECNLIENIGGEEDIYELFELGYIPPELRHYPLQEASRLAKKVISSDSINGELHVHTLYSDGINSVEDMVKEAEIIGYKYLGIAEHSRSLRIGHGLSIGELIRQIKEVKLLNKRYQKFKLLIGNEVDILPNGDLDYPEEILAKLDFVIAAIHSHTKQSQEEMTNRILKAIQNPYVNMLAHPTGSLTSRPGNFFSVRSGWNMDFKRIAKACVDNNVALELNSFPERLDINEKNTKTAVALGAKIILNTDAHSAYHMNLLKYGVDLSRRAGCSQADIINTWTWTEIKNYFRKKKKLDPNFVNSQTEKPRALISNAKTNKFDNLFGAICARNRPPTVIGIDLTGSEKRKSGWAYISGKESKTLLLSSDNELIDASIDLEPDLISIDSPLSLPTGRCCAKEDCECRKFGITRLCERFLMANGIGTYPCLIPSMVNLTLRGIDLKEKFENIGFKVIESYPGAAQDVLGIPRKGRGISLLYDGLRSFGLRLNKKIESISHDELDAITSALVGYFYLSKQFLPLGDDRENYLIIPSVSAFKIAKSGPIVIAITGETGSGKTTAGWYIALKYGFHYIRYSQIIKLISGETDQSDKSNLQKIGWKLHKEIGQREITKKLIAVLPDFRHVVIDGMRFPEDLITLREEFGDRLFPIVIETERKIILQRLARNPYFVGKKRTWLNQLLDHNVEKSIFELSFKIMDKVPNNSSFKELFSRIDRLIREIN